MWTIFVDGASRGNPGLAGAGICILDENNQEVVRESIYLGKKTNNQAEYLALAFAICLLKHKLKKISESNYPEVLFISDSELLVKQMKGVYKVKNPILGQIKIGIDKMLTCFSCRFKHVFREKNVTADFLANVGIDKRLKPKAYLLACASKYEFL